MNRRTGEQAKASNCSPCEDKNILQEQADARPLLHVILSQVVGHHEPSGGDDGREAEHKAAEQPDPQAVLA